MATGISPGILSQLLTGPSATVPRATPDLKKSRGPGIRYVVADQKRTEEHVKWMEQRTEHRDGVLAKSVRNVLNGTDDSIERLAFERDPFRINEFAGIYRPKLQLLPDSLLKRIAIQDDLVAAVVHTRASHISQFGRKQDDRHSKGFVFEENESITEHWDENQKKRLQERIERAERILSTCGFQEGYDQQSRCSFSEYLYMSARNAVVVGRMATEVIYVEDPRDPSRRRFHSFRPVDAGTVYYASPYQNQTDQVRKQARHLLGQLANEKFSPERFKNDEYSWIQVIEGRPVQAFTAEELLVQNFFPATDYELQGYPLTPLDCAIAAVTTHINITTHNKMYFQSGRAARGMLVIKSQDVDVDVIQAVKAQFNASINGVGNAWRMPVFGINPDDELNWTPIDQGQRDMEFQFLSDSNARTILAAFQMSPEELPGYQHLTRGTNNQALAESNEEYKLTAARDVGIRPLLAKFEDHLNSDLIPLIDPELAKVVKLKLIGLDAETEEKESVRIQQDMAVHMTYNEVLGKVEKKPMPEGTVGDLPLNPTVWQYMQTMMTFGAIEEKFMGVKGAAKDPAKQFYQNPYWFQAQQMQMEAQQMQQQAQQQAMGGGQPQPSPEGGSDGGDAPAPSGGGSEQPQEEQSDLGAGIDQLLTVFGKSELMKGEKNLPAAKKKMKALHRLTNDTIMRHWAEDQQKLTRSIVETAARFKPRKS